MGDTIEALRALQEIELELAALRGRRQSNIRRLDAQKRKVREAESRLSANRRTRQTQQMRLDALSLEVSAREASIVKHREALNTAKTNKEYASVLTAMNTEKADTSKLENEMLVLMDEVGKLDEQAAEIEGEVAKHNADVAKAQDRLDKFDADKKPEFDRLGALHEKAAEDVPPEALNTFTRVAERHEGEALAPIHKLHPKRDEFACGGCNMTVVLEVVEILKSNRQIEVCRSCGRVLYYDTAELTPRQ